MQNFIVLGIVPGTNIQLDFTDWLLITAILIMSYVLATYISHHFRTFTLPSLQASNQNKALIGPISGEEALA